MGLCCFVDGVGHAYKEYPFGQSLGVDIQLFHRNACFKFVDSFFKCLADAPHMNTIRTLKFVFLYTAAKVVVK